MKKIISALLLMCFLLSSIAYAESATSQLQEMYAQAELLMATGDYAGAASKFEAMGAYSDASQMAMYCKAVAAAETLGMYDVAIEAFKNLGDFKDSKQMATYYDGRKNQAAADYIIGEDITAVSDGDLETAEYSYKLAADTFAGLALFKDCLSRMSDCQTKAKVIDAEQDARKATRRENRYQEALALEQNDEFEDAIEIYKELRDYKDCAARITVCNNGIKEQKYQNALTLEQNYEFEDAIEIYKELRDYKDCAARITVCNNGIKEQKYQSALMLEQQKEYEEAITLYRSLGDYKDCSERITACFEANISKPVFWQLTAIKANSDDTYLHGTASAETNVNTISSFDDYFKAFDAVKEKQIIKLSVSRDTKDGLKIGEATYTLSGVPVIVSGSGVAQFTLTAKTKSDTRPFLLYAVLRADGEYIARARDNETWICKICFPELAVPGRKYEISLKARELYGVPEVTITFVYTAVAGSATFNEEQNIVVLKDEKDQEITTFRGNQTELFAKHGLGTDDGIIFSADTDDERGVVIQFLPHEDINIEDVLQIIHELKEDIQKDAAITLKGGQNFTTLDISSLPMDSFQKDSSVLWISKEAVFSDETLKWFINIAFGGSTVTAALQDIVPSDHIVLDAVPDKSPKPMTLSELRNRIDNGTTLQQIEKPIHIGPIQALLYFSKSEKPEAMWIKSDSDTDVQAVAQIAMLLQEIMDKADAHQLLNIMNDLDSFITIQNENGSSIGCLAINRSACAVLTTRNGNSTLIIGEGSTELTVKRLQEANAKMNTMSTPTPTPTPMPTPIPTHTPNLFSDK